MEYNCPHCGAPLPEEAAFCPYCAQPVRPRAARNAPIPQRKKVLLAAVVLAIVLAVALEWYLAARPRVYDGVGEVFYTDGGTAYQLAVAWPNNRCQPAPDIYQFGRVEEATRWPSRLYVNYKDTGADAWPAFSQSVEQVTVEVVQDRQGATELAATSPAHDSYSPDAAMVSYLDFTGECGSPQVVWTVRMKNGDLIRVRQNIIVTCIHTYTYDYRDYPMDTLEELQALLDQIEGETGPRDEVNICLPPVTYTGQLDLLGRSYAFWGSADGAGRTTFTDTVQVVTEDAFWINYFYDIDFVGDGGGVGISACGKCWAEGCTFTGWKTGVLGYGTDWVNVSGCRLTGNGVGFHFNSTGQSASHSLYDDNIFRANGTAVLLENVPTDLTLDFVGSVFAGNDTDIDNRCNHPVDISQATFSGAP